jgi:hypothetical protein
MSKRKKSPGKSTEPVSFDPDAESRPDWEHTCDNCGASPIVPATGLCGPCTFGDASTAGGNW